MKGPTSLDTLIERQRRYDQYKEDMTVDTTTLELDADHHKDLTLCTNDQKIEHTMSDHALYQLCSLHTIDRQRWLDVQALDPVKGYSVRTTFARHINASFLHRFGLKQNKEVSRLIRLDTPPTGQRIVRAILSRRYAPYPTKDLLERTKEAIKLLQDKGTGFTVFQYSQEMDSIFIRLISTSRSAYGDGRGSLHSGVILGNSEDGTRSLFCEGFVADDYCMNGLIFGKRKGEQQEDTGIHRRHIGDIRILQHRFNLALADAFQMADKMMVKFLDLQHQKVDDPLDIIQDIVTKRKTKAGFSETLSEAAKGIYMSNYAARTGNNMFSVVSAVTQAAQTLEKDEDRVLVEREMGALVASHS